MAAGFLPGNAHPVLRAGAGQPANIAEALGIPVGEELARIDRLRLADDEPLCVEESFLVHRFMPGILEHDLSAKSLREVKQAVYGIRWSRAAQNHPGHRRAGDAHLLSIKVGAPSFSSSA